MFPWVIALCRTPGVIELRSFTIYFEQPAPNKPAPAYNTEIT
jgi:hypothetical protein